MSSSIFPLSAQFSLAAVILWLPFRIVLTFRPKASKWSSSLQSLIVVLRFLFVLIGMLPLRASKSWVTSVARGSTGRLCDGLMSFSLTSIISVCVSPSTSVCWLVLWPGLDEPGRWKVTLRCCRIPQVPILVMRESVCESLFRTNVALMGFCKQNWSHY